MKTFSIAMVGTWKTNERSSDVEKPEQSQQNVPLIPPQSSAPPGVHWPLLARSSWRHWPWLRQSQPCQTQCCHRWCARHRFGSSEKQSTRLVLLSLERRDFFQTAGRPATEAKLQRSVESSWSQPETLQCLPSSCRWIIAISGNFTKTSVVNSSQ